MAHIWEDLLSDLDRNIYHEAGYGARGGGGKRPALLIIDCTYEFIGTIDDQQRRPLATTTSRTIARLVVDIPIQIAE